jgi:uncharacterized protein (TIGR00369 family)
VRRRDLTGRELLEKIRDGTLPPAPLAALLGMRIVEIDDGAVTFVAQATTDAYNPIGVVHGGWIATLLDSAIGTSVTSKVEAGRAAVTLDLQVRYFKPVTVESGLMRCEGKVINMGRTTATGEAHLYDAQRRLHAHATSTLAIIVLRPSTGSG